MEACAAAWLRTTGTVLAWDWRSLGAFGDQPLDEVAPGYDLLVIDHPLCGAAAGTRSLWPLDDLLPKAVLDALAADAVGSSHTSYSYAGHQWGVAVDAACQVAAARDDLIAGVLPTTWEGVLALARAWPGRVALPLAPGHAISSFFTLCANLGEPVARAQEDLVGHETGLRALEVLIELHQLGPQGTTQLDPPAVLTRLTSGDELLYVPLIYGYVTYARADSVARPCRFIDIPSAGKGPIGAVLGGAGLAVSAHSAEPHEAAAFAAWVSGSEAQTTIVAHNWGQPSSRAVWLDAGLDAEAGGFYSGTRATVEAAWVRPRHPWWPAFQLESGRVLATSLDEGLVAPETLRRLGSLYRAYSMSDEIDT
jgi:multiple sugar transport system substrate-binding protein